jgi:NAD(P)H-hydrate epimerase
LSKICQLTAIIDYFIETIYYSYMKKYVQGSDEAVMSRDEVRGVDEWAIKTMGIPGVVLMENAGRSCAEFICMRLEGVTNPFVCIFCGTGNNGGDGYVIARHLYNANVRCRVILCGNAFKIKGDAKINLDIIMKMGVEIQQIDVDWRDIENKVKDFTRGASLLVDGLFGTGLQGQLADNYRALINAINARGIPIIAVDIPSGLDCDSGQPLGTAIKAEATITFVAVKKGFAADPASAQYTGDIYVAGIGIEPKK